jgi:hypothetical protein
MTARRRFGRGTLSRGAVVWLRQSYPAAIAPMLRTTSDKTLLLQAEAVEIRIPLDYYPAPDSATEPRRKIADPQQRAYRSRGRRCGKRNQ